ncbi:MAG: DNA-3-methyladenine glycosylase [Bacteroidota bacterium]
MKKLPASFYHRTSVVTIAKELLGKLLVTSFNDELTAGRIVETEAYNGVVDKAAHSYGGRRTNRTEIMYATGGVTYVYLCYGIHHLFNVVTNVQDIPQAILIRGIEPVTGINIMLRRMKKEKADHSIGRGPGNVSKALGITVQHTSLSLQESNIYIADDGVKIKPAQIIATARIGVDYAADDALLPYRFYIKDNPYVSGKKQFKS